MDKQSLLKELGPFRPKLAEALCLKVENPNDLVEIGKKLGYLRVKSTSITVVKNEGNTQKIYYYIYIPLEDGETLEGFYLDDLAPKPIMEDGLNG